MYCNATSVPVRHLGMESNGVESQAVVMPLGALSHKGGDIGIERRELLRQPRNVFLNLRVPADACRPEAV